MFEEAVETPSIIIGSATPDNENNGNRLKSTFGPPKGFDELPPEEKTKSVLDHLRNVRKEIQELLGYPKENT